MPYTAYPEKIYSDAVMRPKLSPTRSTLINEVEDSCFTRKVEIMVFSPPNQEGFSAVLGGPESWTSIWQARGKKAADKHDLSQSLL